MRDVYKRQILDMARYKEEGNLKALLVAGCLAQRYKQEIMDEIPEVDAILGTTSYEEVAKVLEQVLEGRSGTRCVEETGITRSQA